MNQTKEEKRKDLLDLLKVIKESPILMSSINWTVFYERMFKLGWDFDGFPDLIDLRPAGASIKPACDHKNVKEKSSNE